MDCNFVLYIKTNQLLTHVDFLLFPTIIFIVVHFMFKEMNDFEWIYA